MIKIDLSSLEKLDLQQLIQPARQVTAEWSKQYNYYTHQAGNPNYDPNQYQKLLNAVQTNAAGINAFVQQPAKHANSVSALLQKLNQFQDSYDELTKYCYMYSEVGRLEDEFFKRLSTLESNIAASTEKKVEELSTTVREDISKGIQDLIGLKSELGLAKQFGEKIQDELKNADSAEKNFFMAFIGVLALIPFLNVFILYKLTNLEAIEKYIVTGSVTISILVISYFFYAQYRTYLMLRLRYTHLDGFLGGGATFLSQLLEAENPEFKLEVNKKLAEMFMSLDDVLQMVHKSKHPTELTLDTAEKVFDKVSKFKK